MIFTNKNLILIIIPLFKSTIICLTPLLPYLYLYPYLNYLIINGISLPACVSGKEGRLMEIPIKTAWISVFVPRILWTETIDNAIKVIFSKKK